MKKDKKTIIEPTDAVTILWQEGFFVRAKTFNNVVTRLNKRGNNFKQGSLLMALNRAKFITAKKNNGSNSKVYMQKYPFVSLEVDEAREELLEEKLITKLGNDFEQELADLYLNFGKSGNCTAFTLRKILEKLIYITFAKNGIETKLEDKNTPGRLVGLEAMINLAAQEKLGGIPFLTNKTAQEVKGIKFLGDTSAHNPLVNVDMETILPQMPFITIAYKELAERL